MKINDSIWFTNSTSMQIIGIVLATDEVTNERKAYIGIGEGHDEAFDAHNVLNWGSKLSPEMLITVLKFISPQD